jgi:hypothetical protein
MFQGAWFYQPGDLIAEFIDKGGDPIHKRVCLAHIKK